MIKISVIIPVFNAEKTLFSTLESVRNQTYKGDFEIILINDGSTDGSDALIKNYQVQHPELNIIYIQQDNKGVSAARKAGLNSATGE